MPDERDELNELLNDEASLLSDEKLLFASLLMSLPVFFTSFLVLLEHAEVPNRVPTASAATTMGVMRLRMTSGYPPVSSESP